MTWFAVSVPPFVSSLLGSCQLEMYSEAQALLGILDTFVQLPAQKRIDMVEEYLQQHPPSPPSSIRHESTSPLG
jgi:hypothetical protein